MQPVIRKLKLEDAGDVNRLSQQLGYSLQVEDTTRQIEIILAKTDHIAFVAINNDEVVGWVHAFQASYLESLPFVEIGGLVVDKNYRGKGIGKILLNEVKQWCMKQRVYRLRVRTQTTRHDAQRFYVSFGFKDIKEQKVYQIELLPKEK